MSKVHNAGTSLLSIINDILDFSKIEADKLDIETTDFELDEVISTVTTLTAQKAHDKGLEFLIHAAFFPGGHVHDAQTWRHRAWALDLAQARGVDGRARLARKRTGQRQHV